MRENAPVPDGAGAFFLASHGNFGDSHRNSWKTVPSRPQSPGITVTVPKISAEIKEGSDGGYNIHRAAAEDTGVSSGRTGPLRRTDKEIPGGRARRSQNAEASPALRDLRPAPGRRPDAADQIPWGNLDLRPAYPARGYRRPLRQRVCSFHNA